MSRDHYWLDVRYTIHDKMRWVYIIHIIEYEIGDYTNMHLKVCHQAKVKSLTKQSPPSMCL